MSPARVSICRSCLRALRNNPSPQTHAAPVSVTTQKRNLSTPSSRSASPPKQETGNVILNNASATHTSSYANDAPRWMRTPAAMKSQLRTQPRNDNQDFPCNEDPVVLDQMYRKLLGREGPNVLPEEVKWLAITHKSFDQGRRGFNDRLAFLGRRILDLQTSLALLQSSSPDPSSKPVATQLDQYGRTPFTTPSTVGVENISAVSKHSLTSPVRLARLAESYGLPQVIRWKPRQIRNLKSSGLDTVLAQTMYAIVGAIALQKGGEAAADVARKSIIAPLMEQ